MIFSKNYVNYVFPEDECERLFMQCMSLVYTDGGAVPTSGQFHETDLPESMKQVMMKDDYIDFMMSNPFKVRGYMCYSVKYCLANDIVNSEMFIDSVMNSYKSNYDYDNIGVYSIMWFDSSEITEEFYRAFYEFLLPILQYYRENFYSDDDVNHSTDEINFSYEFPTLYRLYHEFGVEARLNSGVLSDVLLGWKKDSHENYERPKKRGAKTC